jgi:hypothetical protein
MFDSTLAATPENYPALLAERVDPGKGMTGVAIALGDLALMRSAGIDPPGMLDVERFLRTFRA